MTQTEPQIQTLVDLIRFRARVSPETEAVFFGEEVLTFGQLEYQARCMATALTQKGIGRGDRVIIALPNGLGFFRCFYAVQWLGAVAVPLFPNLGPKKMAAIAHQCQAKAAVLPEGSKAGAALEEGLTLACRVFGDEDGRHLPPHSQASEVKPDAVAFLQYTSGSTGDPKGVMLTHGGLICNIKQLIAGMGITEQDVFVSWLPVFHDMGLILKTMVPFYLGCRLYLLPTQLSNPKLWLRTIAQVGGTFTAAPDFAYRLCLRYIRDVTSLNIASLRFALNAAEPVRASTVRQFEQRFGLGRVMVAGYGLAEATVGVCSMPPASPLRMDQRGLVAVGRPLPGVQLRIKDEQGQERPPGATGAIWVKSPANCLGYWGRPDLNKQLMDKDGFLPSGDLGYRDEEGYLYISGRLKNVIIAAGRTVANQEIEEIIDQHPEVRASAAVGIDRGGIEGEQIFVFCEVSSRPRSLEVYEDLSTELVASLHGQLGLRPARLFLVKPKTLPRTHNGKLRHAALRQDFLDGGLSQQDRLLFPQS